MIEFSDGVLKVTSPMRIGNARQLYEDGSSIIAAGTCKVDLSAVDDADSSALSVLLRWTSIARAQGSDLQITNMPTSVRSLQELYGIESIL